ncbi:hypothetical protein ACQR5V_21495 [Xanthomonas oryzae pv. oryzicola]|uniref:hypothetical protein n=1 Tax=Xanthomonas oryzae TaxID=347 RepID=UPI0005CDD6D0|nr:hypothetical protein [Xanthomonas oryzae]AJQ88068.1 hypothetical protein BE73_14185 [Xanthomonas oryzae pv. oryzicola]AVU02487.1 hypothetical protein C0L90_08505 [Xanthomonas oryzae pv. oryzae]OWB26845.1 hypothetical protein XocBAI21_17450 [Xanthomonas oryzae pv. oryzicola]QBI15686.1 hypothetical protein EYR03_08570 [Xanthomonas oryzae pv. oryzae]QBI15735.1 hypothetical protein EYR03_08860 [Xanthomonas oryzae pv. oryzae]
MRSDTNQTDVFRDSPATKAAQWRAAAEKCAEQFPGDSRRLRYYESHAEMYEAQCNQIRSAA